MRPGTLGAVWRAMLTPLYKNTVFLILNTAIIAGLGFLFWIVVDKLYAGDVLAYNLVLIQTTSYLGLLSTLGFGHGWIRFLPNTREDRGEMINSCLTVALLASLGISAVFLAGVGLWYPDGRVILTDPLFVMAFMVFVMLFVALPLSDYIFVARRTAGLAAAKNTLLQISKLLLLVPLVAFARDGAIVLAFGLGALATVALTYAHLARRVIPGYRPWPRFNLRIVRAIFHYSFLSHLMEVLTIAPGILLLILVNNTYPEASHPGVASTFGIVWVIVGTAILVIPTAAATSLFAEGSHAQDNLARDLKRALRFVLPLLALVTVGLVVFGRYVLLLFRNVDIGLGLPLLQAAAFSGIFYTINSLWMAVRRVEKRMVSVVLLAAFVATFTMGSTALLLPRLGVMAAAYSWVLAQALASAAIGIGFLLHRLPRWQQALPRSGGAGGIGGNSRRQ